MGDDSFASPQLTPGQASPSDLNCTANDIDIATADITRYSFDGITFTDLTPGGRVQCLAGDTIFVETVAHLQNNATSRWDIGVWLAASDQNPTYEMKDGNVSFLTNALTGSCTHYNLTRDSVGVANLDSDACGDMVSGTQTALRLDVLKVACSPDQSGNVSVGACIGWQNQVNGPERVCADNGTAFDFRKKTTPDNKAKCNCNPMVLPIDLLGILRVKKTTVPSGDPTAFTFTPTGWNGGNTFTRTDAQGAFDSELLTSGEYSVAETIPTGWNLTGRSCVLTGTNTPATFSNTGTNGVTVELGQGQDVTCTFTNTATASIALQKETVGGTATFSFNGTGNGISNTTRNTATQGNPTTVAATTLTGNNVSGDKYFEEVALTGWTITNITCTANGGTVVIGSGGSGAFAAGTTNGFDAGDNTVKITTPAGSSPTCTFQNTLGASVSIQKQTIGGFATFDYTSDAGSTGIPSTFQRTTSAGANPTNVAAFPITALQLGTKYVAETAKTGWTLTSITCSAGVVIGTGTGAGFSQGTSAGFDAGDNSVQIPVTAGSSPSCTFVNTKNASLEIEKQSLGGTAEFDYTVVGAPLVAFTRNTATQGNPTSTSPVTILPGDFGDKYITETAETGYTLTNIQCQANGAVFAIGTGTGAGFSQGATAGFDAGDNTIKITIDAGDTPVCRFLNTKQGSITIVKEDKNPETDPQAFAFTATGTGMTPASFNLDDDGEIINTPKQTVFSGLLPNGARTVTEGTNANWTLTNIACTGNTSSTITYNGHASFQAGDRQVSITLAAGENITCTYTNQRNARLIIEKEVVGGGTQSFDFSRTNGGTLNFSLTNGGSNNSGFTLAPAQYTTCELLLAVAWATTATAGNTGGSLSAVTLVNPDLPQDLGNRCYAITLNYGDDKTIHFVNTPPPGGNARTIGYWKNWSSCTGGNQYTKAQARNQLDRTLDFYLNPPSAAVFPIGLVTSLTCQQAVYLLGKTPIDGSKKSANDPAFNMVAQLFAAKLNYASGAQQCNAASQAMTDAQTLLVAISFNGLTHTTLTSTQAAQLNAIAGILDKYNNNTLVC